MRKAEAGGEARFDIVLEEARVVRQIFTWVAQERLAVKWQRGSLVDRGGSTRSATRFGPDHLRPDRSST